MAKKLGFKPSTPNTNKHNLSQGSFNPSNGQKPGRKAAAGKERSTNPHQTPWLHKVVKNVRKQVRNQKIGRSALVNGTYA